MITQPGIIEVSVALSTSRGHFVYDSEKTGPRDIMSAVEVSLFYPSMYRNASNGGILTRALIGNKFDCK